MTDLYAVFSDSDPDNRELIGVYSTPALASLVGGAISNTDIQPIQLDRLPDGCGLKRYDAIFNPETTNLSIQPSKDAILTDIALTYAVVGGCVQITVYAFTLSMAVEKVEALLRKHTLLKS